MIRRVIWGFALLLCGPWQLAAQAPEPERLLRGTVRDAEGRRLAGALVRVLNDSSVRALADGTGAFRLGHLPAPSVTLIVSRDGFEPLTLDVDVPADTTRLVDLVLFATSSMAQALARGVDSARTRILPTRLRGTVIDSAGRPLLGAVITVVPATRGVPAVSSGRGGQFNIPVLDPGPTLLRVRLLGYAPITQPITMPDTGAVEVVVTMVPAGQQLERVVVTSRGTGSLRLDGFEARRARGAQGQFLRRDEFINRGPTRLSDALQTMLGVRVLPDSRGQRRAYGRAQCELKLLVDGVPAVLRAGDSIDDFVTINDIAAIEAYPRLVGMPPEFMSRLAASDFGNNCGAIIVWTRVGPDQPRR